MKLGREIACDVGKLMAVA